MGSTTPSPAPVGCVVVCCFIVAMGGFLAGMKGEQARKLPRHTVTVLAVKALEKGLVNKTTDYYVHWGGPVASQYGTQYARITAEMAQRIKPGDEIEVIILDGSVVVPGGPGFGDFSDGTTTARFWMIVISISIAVIAIAGYVVAYKNAKGRKGEVGLSNHA